MKNINEFEWKKPKFLLINFGIEALGVRHLSSFLKRLGCRVNILFLQKLIEINISYTYADLVVKYIDTNNYDIVGFSCMTGDYFEVKLMTYLIKERLERPPLIIWGGVHPTIYPEECLKEGGADIVFNAAPEEALIKLLSGTSINKVPNIAYLDKEELINNYSNVHLLSPDSMPFPDFDFEDHFVIENNKILRLNVKLFRARSQWNGTHYYAITARGCPYHCSYCCNIYRRNYQRKSVDYFLEELRFIEKKLPFFQTLSIQDDSLFLKNTSWINDFSEKYRKEFNKPLRAALMPRLATLDKLKPLSEAGLSYVGIGLQGSSRLNKEIYGRMETSESFLRAVDNYKKFGITGRVDIIVNNPYEREEDLIEIANTLNEVPKPFPISVFTLTLFPGTRLVEKAKKDGLAHMFVGDPYEPGLSPSEKKKTGYKTPEYWIRLYNDYLPNLPSKICKYLIKNIRNQDMRKKVVKYSLWAGKVREIGKTLRNISPQKFDKFLKYYQKKIH